MIKHPLPTVVDGSETTVEVMQLGGVRIERAFISTDGTFPNNPSYPLLLYRGVYRDDRDGDGEALLLQNGWSRPWAWGVFEFHHYHSTAWEALLCVRGEAEVQFGGPTGPVLKPVVGDLVLVPPGVAHKQGRSSGDFLLLGSYPDHEGCSTPNADTVRGAPTPRQSAAIRDCPAPLLCPRWGASTPWSGGVRRLMTREDTGGLPTD
eukprot:CAMPEP_0203888886 /NCGR_PEP_ID=MMETSP0359-20131031/32498_1 /ASSEMBLY_ACC=CAM_ASM_000338 /TAXON_ID=268821 /ORGANISM="Scrippsiella Hangoei, Strain SHTV-5" /LENGTH=205 /DNA_ID=CAMNT_0050810181 /DNA_START=204 /DNA_END=821 /DNA_ORIENTATION=-